ncbi:hypothetical protein C8Q72DRAFT_796238 [Fomitopsis betulina]|nr:hypothetical protein C8Q72DRAFT_796238 [Fomitopsis betulina]
MNSPLMDCSQFFPSSSPSRSTRPVADARSSSPSGKTDPASEDRQSHNALNNSNSFQDSGYGDSVEDSEHDHRIKVATPSSVSIDGRDPVVNLVFTQLFGSRFPHKVDVFSNWFEDELFPWVTGTTGREPSNRIVHLPQGVWANIQQYIDRIGGRSFCFVLRFLYNSKLETLIMSVTKKTHVVVPGAVFDIVKHIAIPEQHLPYTLLSYDSSAVAPYAVVGEEKKPKIIKQVPDCKVTSVLRVELQSLGNQELLAPRTVFEMRLHEDKDDGEGEGEDEDEGKGKGKGKGKHEHEGEEDTDNEVLAIGSTMETSPTPATEQASSSTSVAPAVPAPSVPTPAVLTPTAIAIKAVEDPTLQKDRPLQRSTKQVGEQDEILACLPVILVNIDKIILYEASMAQDLFIGDLWHNGQWMAPQRKASILVFPDDEGLETLRLGAKEGWSEDVFIANGYGMHVVPLLRHKMRKDESLRQEYTAFKGVWSRFMDRFRWLQCAYDRMAVATVYSKKSEKVQQYLTTYHPELRKLLKELPDPSSQGDAGLESLVDLLSSKLRAASKSMVAEQVQNREAEFDELMGTISKLHREVQTGTFMKKPRYRKHSRPKFRFSELQIQGEDPSEMLAYGADHEAAIVEVANTLEGRVSRAGSVGVSGVCRLTDKDQLPPQQRGRGLKRTVSERKDTASSKHLFNLGEGWYNGLVHGVKKQKVAESQSPDAILALAYKGHKENAQNVRLRPPATSVSDELEGVPDSESEAVPITPIPRTVALAHLQKQPLFEPPPSIEEALIALQDLHALLRPRRKSGIGFLQFVGDDQLQSHLE